MSDRRKPLPLIFLTVQVARCPHCGSDKHSHNGSRDQGDGSRLCYRVCSRCERAFRTVTEFVPVSGKDADAGLYDSFGE